MKDNEFQKCRCGHTEDEHQWKKNSPYDGPEIFANPFVKDELRSHLRLKCRSCSCQRFNPPASHKAKWFGIGIAIFVVLAIISRMFLY